MRLLADENIRAELVTWLRAAGHDVAVVPRGVANGAVLTLASDERRTLLTHDKDFAALWISGRKPPYGIIHLRIHPPEVTRLTTALAAALPALRPGSFEGRLIIVETEGFRIQ